ncbi:MAG TPA: hypothetical protein VGR20_09735 [Acidimicrobiia bacterium]|jgi:hypothetical protein|nr:hypothetical protein [Acidimicrobiia bacterium]
MAIDERARHQLYLRLEEHLGAEAATTLMEHLPPTGWADVATKRDLDHLAAATRADIDHLAAATKRDLDHLAAATKADIDHLGAATKADIDHLRGATSSDIQRMGDQLRAELHKTIATHTVVIVFATMATSIASVFAAAQLH